MEAARVVRTAYGEVGGRVEQGVSAYLGIPYAAPPFGPRRFQRPQPPEPWDGVRDATAHGPTAPKPPYPHAFAVLLPDPDIEGEDCLNLNVWTPDPGASGLPVLVWIHGGAFRNGSGAIDVYSGARFARDGAVCVTINYRLGVEGFAHLPGAPANRGLLDQIAALEWVRDNIAAFGGDPGEVTVFGESAGAMSVVTLLSLDLGLFRRAVAQSGAGQVVQTAEDALLVTRETAARLGVEPTAEGFAAVAPRDVLRVQAAVAAEVTAMPDPARWGVSTCRNGMSLTPVLDGELLREVPADAIAAGAGRDVDLLIGCTAEEFRLFLVPTGLAAAVTPELVGPIAAGMGTPQRVVEAHLAAPGDATPGDRLAAIITETLFRTPAERVALAHGPRTWFYEFAWASPVEGLGACHALEIGFVFDTLDLPGNRPLGGPHPPQELADAMHGAWLAFARGEGPGWEPFDAGARRVKVFDGEKNPVVEDPRPERRALWAED
ncbi:carboxylesterase/lipase family protein [Actinomadura parmotrematis]|uniref:Carboxylic ester hydrolase n=1 Tax=Actinomadura parmotrematis TaxID=2864039 RepID=A0ABS7G1B1_9ACTN|nr:carboxylesterase family protein [Actinomadura parmotrematis]MBW8486281.1 carboxylesterase family protein [Actinomadura parmotrematis]